MIGIDPAVLAEHQKRAGTISHTLFYVVARDKTDDSEVPLGLWTGEDTATFTIGGQARTYIGSAVIGHDAIAGAVGLDVRTMQIRIPHIAPVGANLLQAYDARFAPVEMHVAAFALESRALLAAPRRIFKGWIDEAPIPTGAAGDETEAVLTLASIARALTQTLPLRRADADQRRRDATDAGRLYASVQGLIEVPWGEGKVKARDVGAVTPNPGGSAGSSYEEDLSNWGP